MQTPIETVPVASAPAQLIVCCSCDAIYRRLSTAPSDRAECAQCGSELYRAERGGLDTWLALALTGLIAWVIANVYPIVELRLGNERVDATLVDALSATWNEGMPVLALLVGLCAFVLPLLKLALEIHVLAFAVQNRRPPAMNKVLSVLGAIRPWSMIDVFLIGVLVSIVKLGADTTVIMGPGLGGFAVLAVAMAAMSGFDPMLIWTRLGRLEQ